MAWRICNISSPAQDRDQCGDPRDLAELPNTNRSDVSTTASDLGSGVSLTSSSASSALDDKLTRLLNQVKAIKIGASISNGGDGGDSVDVNKDSKESTSTNLNEKMELSLPPGDTPHQRVAAILKIAKARRLEAENKMSSDPEQRAKAPTAVGSSSHESTTGGDEIPEYVP